MIPLQRNGLVLQVEARKVTVWVPMKLTFKFDWVWCGIITKNQVLIVNLYIKLFVLSILSVLAIYYIVMLSWVFFAWTISTKRRCRITKTFITGRFENSVFLLGREQTNLMKCLSPRLWELMRVTILIRIYNEPVVYFLGNLTWNLLNSKKTVWQKGLQEGER